MARKPAAQPPFAERSLVEETRVGRPPGEGERGSERSASSATDDPPGTFEVLMLGWEFPPFISGGLGTACYGLTKAMSRRGDRVLFVMPGPSAAGFSAAAAPPDSRTGRESGGIALPEFENVEFHGMGVKLTSPYQRATPPGAFRTRQRPRDLPEQVDPVSESRRFATLAEELALREQSSGRRFDVVHAHDWMTFEAGTRLARSLGIPLVAHFHSTEYDRSPDMPEERVVTIEAAALKQAAAVIAVSRFTAAQLRSRYDVPAEKVWVVHNALELESRYAPQRPVQIGAGERVVLFVGRLTPQKGPEYFVRAAARVLKEEPAVRFVMAGTGESAQQVRGLAESLGIERHFLFTGFLNTQDVDRVFRAADLFVMPSVSEPFGLVSLEAAGRRVPVIISKQSGAAEVLEHALKVDFWDVDELASRIVAVLRDETLARQLSERGSFEVRQMRWSDAAEGVARVYAEVTRGTSGRRKDGGDWHERA